MGRGSAIPRPIRGEMKTSQLILDNRFMEAAEGRRYLVEFLAGAGFGDNVS